MMLKLWQKKQKLSYDKEVIDIVQFGSSVIEGSKANDIDIAVIFNRFSVKKQLIEAQKIKKQLSIFSDLPIHIHSFDYYSFFIPSNFSRDNILFNGKSIITGNNFSRQFGLEPRVQIKYSLKHLPKKDKVKLHYLLNGKNKSGGLLNEYGGKIVSPGIVQILPEHIIIFESKINEITKEIEIKKMFLQT
ncbi:MAG: hypothetical protein KKF44_04910 [Nanoarchaeota archaeon]|nr:hypothetical protein [Nanoarchaeota archaeon]